MREYKFRAWDKDKKEMYYQGSNTIYNNGVMDCRIVLDELGFDVLVRLYGKDEYEYRNNCELMQYTNLHDKNGKEIYEGDVIKIFCNRNWDWEQAVVEYENGTYFANAERFHVSLNKLVETGAEFEKIGNKWDNPELLKEGSV